MGGTRRLFGLLRSRRFSTDIDQKVFAQQKAAAEKLCKKIIAYENRKKLYPEVQPGVSTDNVRNVAVATGFVTALSALGWYFLSRDKEMQDIQD